MLKPLRLLFLGIIGAGGAAIATMPSPASADEQCGCWATLWHKYCDQSMGGITASCVCAWPADGCPDFYGH